MTIPQLVEAYPAFTQATVRWWIFNAEQNGFKKCMLRVGGRIYIDRAAFATWLEDHRIEK